MPKVVGVRFRQTGKSYHFSPGDFSLHRGDSVIVETVKGVEIGTVSDEIIDIPENMIQHELKPVLRPADKNDMAKAGANKKNETEAFVICKEKIAQRGLEMDLVDVEFAFDDSKIIFYFTADGRVDFRDLVKDLAGIFRNRIELRQIGVRDEAKMVGGMGICGRELCCSSFLNEFMPVSIKMAKEQNLSMNPAKISGACGRLMCCLKYEHEAYEDAISRMPKPGTAVDTPEGKGVIDGINLLKETVTVKLDKGDETDLHTYKLHELGLGGGPSSKAGCGSACGKNSKSGCCSKE